jgi:hypothetical protein
LYPEASIEGGLVLGQSVRPVISRKNVGDALFFRMPELGKSVFVRDEFVIFATQNHIVNAIRLKPLQTVLLR